MSTCNWFLETLGSSTDLCSEIFSDTGPLSSIDLQPQTQIDPAHTSPTLLAGLDSASVIGEILGLNRLRSKCLQVQPVTCGHPSVFLNEFEVYSINSSKVIGNSPEFLNLNWLFLKLNWFICN